MAPIVGTQHMHLIMTCQSQKQFFFFFLMGISEVVDTSHEMESQALINTPEDETFMEYLVDYDSPNNLAKGDGGKFLRWEFRQYGSIPELQQLSLLIEHADNVPDHLTGKFILDTINQVSSQFTVSNTVFDVLRHRDLINKSLSRLQGTELTKAHEDVLKRQRSLTYTLDELNEKFEELSFIFLP